MTDHPEFLPEPERLESSASEPVSDSAPEATVTVELPVDILTALDRQGQRSGQSQTQMILEVLRSALGLEPAVLSQLHAPAIGGEQAAHPADDSANPSVTPQIPEVEHLKLRLRQLEALIPKVEDLAGKSIAF